MRAPLPSDRFLLRVTVACVLAFLACGEAGPAPDWLYLETFETRCGGLPCGWEQVDGSARQALYRSTIHPGEHGLSLVGGGVTLRGSGGAEGDANLMFGSLQARVAARCDEGSSLVMRLSIADVPDAGTPRTDTLEGRLSPPPEWTGPLLVTLTGRSALRDGGFGGPALSGRIRVLGVTLGKSGSGRCDISEIAVGDVGTLVPDPGPTC